MALNRDRLSRINLILVGLALLGYAAAVVLLAIPVSVPEVQDCGTPGAYLLQGRVDVYPDRNNAILDADGEVVTLSAEVADAARRRPCQDRVAARAVPAAIAVTAATTVGVLALLAEMFLVRPAARRAIRQAWTEEPPPPATPPTPQSPPGGSPPHDQGTPD